MCSAGWHWARSWTAPRRSPPLRNLKRRKRPNRPDPGGTGQSVARNGLNDTMSNHKPVKAKPAKSVWRRSFVHYCWSVPPPNKWKHNISRPITVIGCILSPFLTNQSYASHHGWLFLFLLCFFLSCLHLFLLLAWVTDLMFLFSKWCGCSKLDRPARRHLHYFCLNMWPTN